MVWILTCEIATQLVCTLGKWAAKGICNCMSVFTLETQLGGKLGEGLANLHNP
jgi:hypothetical protein